jgi:uracil-DNA glycosylase family 4
MSSDFCHLHVHTENSILDGVGKPRQYAEAAIDLGFTHLAITDHGNVSGAIKFQTACKDVGITPIFGVEMYIVEDVASHEKGEKRGHITLLAKNDVGWTNILSLLSKSNIEGFFYRPRIEPKWLLENCDGLIIMSACASSFLTFDWGEDLLKNLLHFKKDDLYLEVMPHDFDLQKNVNVIAQVMSNKYGLKLIATNDCFVEDSLVLEKSGIKKIQDVNIGDFAYTHEGRWKKIVHVNSRNLKQNEKVFKIKTTAGTSSGEVTGNHPYYVCNYDQKKHRMINFSWKKAIELKNGDYLLSPKISKADVFLEYDKNEIDLLDYYDPPVNLKKDTTYIVGNKEYIRTIRSDEKNINIPRFLEITDELLSILGYYISQGSLDDGYQFGFSFNIKKEDHINLVINYFRSFGFKEYIRKSGNFIAILYSSVIFYNFFYNTCGKGSQNKHLPYFDNKSFMRQFSKRQLLKIIKEYVEEDGHIVDGLIQVSASVSKILSYEMCCVFNSLGFYSNPERRNMMDTGWNQLYLVNFSGIQAYEIDKIFGFNIIKKPKIIRRRFIEGNKFFGTRFKGLEESTYSKKVYNFEVEEDNSYTCDNFVVHNCHYIRKEDEKSQEVLLAIQTNKKWNDPNRWKFQGSGYYLRTRAEMAKAFRGQNCLSNSEYKEAIENTMEVAEKCRFEIKKLPVSLPRVPKLKDREDIDALKRICEDGIYNKIEKTGKNEKKYRKRYEEELKIIVEKGYARYFLIVWDLVNWCRSNDIFVGPGRGSSGGSLICFLMGITRVDPLEFGLIFARFISPDRIDLPDIDLDFEDIKRPLVRKYFEGLYGQWSVAGVSTYSEMKGRGALRDVSRVFGVPLSDVGKATATIVTLLDGEEGSDHTIADAFNTFEDGKEFKKKYPEVSRIAMNLEGQIRNKGQHAAAIVISDEDLREGRRCAFTLGKDKELLVNWDKDDLEYMGLMKLDVLGLKMLTVLNDVKARVKKNHGQEINFDEIQLEGRKIFREFTKGNNIGCFQVGSQGLRKFCQRVKIDSFMELVHTTSLFRPGTLRSGAADIFIKRKHGEEDIPEQHPIIDKITKDTYGIILYQEQVMQLVHEVAGLDWKTAEKVRKIIAKSKGEEAFKEYEDQFVEGCLKRKTLSEDRARSLWNDLKSMGSYSFNKCLAGDTKVYRSSSGNHTKSPEITIKELYILWRSKTSTGEKYRRKGLYIQQLHEDGRIRPGKIKSVNYSGKQNVFEIKTSSGKIIKATKEHKFLSDNFDYVKVKDLKVGSSLFYMGDYEKTKRTPSDIPRFRGEGKSYSGNGFRFRADNIGFVDGRDSTLKETKKIVFERSKGKCESCGKKIYKYCKECGRIIKIGRPEFSHIKSIDKFNYDFVKYHSPKNILYLCNSCHKKFDYSKGERKIRHSKGRSAIKDPIVSIKPCGSEETFDIEMEGPNHNFIANGIISHNSHAVEYSVITFWGQWCKQNYPSEYLCSLLTYGIDKEETRNEYIEEAFRLGLEIRPPKIGISEADTWTERNGILYAPYIDIKGVGEKTAAKLSKLNDKKKKGFYKDGKSEITPKFQKILEDINAFKDEPLTDDMADSISSLLSISLVRNRMHKYKKLADLFRKAHNFKYIKDIDQKDIDKTHYLHFGEITEMKLGYRIDDKEKSGSAYGTIKDDTGNTKIYFGDDLYKRKKSLIEHCEGEIVLCLANSPRKAGNIICNDAWFLSEIMSGDIEGLDLDLIESNRFKNNDLGQCNDCDLRKECSGPVFSSSGRSNIMIIGEAPGRDEDRLKQGFIGDSGRLLWSELNRHGYTRRDFHVTNVCKCWPSKTKTPTKPQIKKCRRWLEEEIKKISPKLVLAIGNTNIKYFTDDDSGITQKNGICEWNEEYGLWISWVIHPASVLYSPDNRSLFENGIENFVNKIKIFGM